MRTFSRIRGPRRKTSGPTSFKITVLPDLLDKVRTFSHMWGTHREFTGPTSFEITIFLELIDEMRTFIIWFSS